MITFISSFLYTIFEVFFGKSFSKEGFITYARNTQWLTILKFVTMVFSLVTTMIVARILGPETFGTLNYVLSVVGLFAVIANLGVSTVTYRELVANKENRKEILGSAIALTLITGGISIFLILASFFFLHEPAHIKVLILVMSLSFLTQPLTLLSIDFLKDSEAKYTTIAQLITSFISSTLKILVIFLYSSILYFIIILVTENIIAGIIYLYQMKKIKGRSIYFTVSKKQILVILSSSLPLTLTFAFSEIYYRIDQIMLKHYIDTTAVGLYSAAARLTEVWYLIPNILITALFPALVNSSLHSEKEYQKRFNVLALTLLLVSLCISIFTSLFSKTLISIIYGNDFIEAAHILSVYIFSLLGSFISLLLLQDLFLKNKKWLVILLPASTSVLNIVLNIFLIPSYGTIGAALATVISYSMVPVLFYLLKKSP